MLNAIEEKLQAFADKVFYGTADEVKPSELWNYIVFWRDRLARNEGNTGYTDYYNVAVVNENWVPDELISSVIEAMETLSGMRLARSDISFEYTRKPSTGQVIEIAIITFCKSRKRV